MLRPASVTSRGSKGFNCNEREGKALERNEKADKLDAFITRDAGACLRTETADIRMAYLP